MMRILIVSFFVLLTLYSCPEPATISWQNVTTFVNGWQNAAGYQPLQYSIDDWGQVHIRGTAYDPNPVSSSNVFTLPADYHPAYPTVFAVSVQSGGTHTANLWIYPEGETATRCW
ncbi:MAG: hypothetical protein JW904_00765 [Spirochaetales bacterium]|nr:hypothetical protein [Spirochaetales bacterium]